MASAFCSKQSLYLRFYVMWKPPSLSQTIRKMFLFYPFILRFTPQKTISILYALMRIILFQIYIFAYSAQKTISMCIGMNNIICRELAFPCAKFNLFHTLNNTFLHSYSHGTICMYILSNIMVA